MKPFFTGILLLLSYYTFGQKSNVFGKYLRESGKDTLIIKTDSTFTIIIHGKDATNKSIRLELNGKCKIDKHYIYLKAFSYYLPSNDEEKINGSLDYWFCAPLKREGYSLKRPLHCTPTHRFLIFKKIKE